MLMLSSLPTLAEDANYFLIGYSAGASWNDAISYREQPGLKTHHDFIRDLNVGQRVVMAGSVPGSVAGFVGVVLLMTDSREEAESIVSQDPGIQTRQLGAVIIPWDVSLSSLQVLRRKPAVQIEDPDQSFSIKRLDPDSRLNIEGNLD